jgi:hypothetical protein
LTQIVDGKTTATSTGSLIISQVPMNDSPGSGEVTGLPAAIQNITKYDYTGRTAAALLNGLVNSDTKFANVWNSTVAKVLTSDAINLEVGGDITTFIMSGEVSGQLSVPLRGNDAFYPLIGIDYGGGGGGSPNIDLPDVSGDLTISRTWMLDGSEPTAKNLGGPRESFSANTSIGGLAGGSTIELGESGNLAPSSFTYGNSVGISIDRLGTDTDGRATIGNSKLVNLYPRK